MAVYAISVLANPHSDWAALSYTPSGLSTLVDIAGQDEPRPDLNSLASAAVPKANQRPEQPWAGQWLRFASGLL